ncbi:helix-turn-helix domain-containing protein [Tropicimonas sp. IMCC34011]|uniref:helix-turn-helix domain-containing protein n=1 Tax=Tropicimonas sp. IMCC34011 TaxID=2248759 RepID=UPI000E27CFD1|nr:helix-turn-helix domain-containing protein [Tropicimonas sp. IMCC34011]
MITAPDDSYSAAEAAQRLEVSERQVHRYLEKGRLRGSKASGRWRITELQIWVFQGIADEMLASWREYCRSIESAAEISAENQTDRESGE